MTQSSGRETPNPEVPQAGGASDGKYVLVVGGLLALIVIALAALYLRERSARIDAQEDLVEQREQFRSAMMHSALSGFSGGKAAGPALDPRELRSGQVTLDGRTRPAVFIDPDAAADLGLRSGEVLIVEERQ